MAMQPLTGACFSIFVANVVFIVLPAEKKHHSGPFVKVFPPDKKMRCRDGGLVLDCFRHERSTYEWSRAAGARRRCSSPVILPPLATVPCSKCGHPIMMPMMLRQFELRSIIGSGGMGTVYRAWDTTLERMVAVKLMKKELLQDPKALEAFYREARACARLNHTNIVHIYTFDEWEGQRYLVMELADRGSLDARIEKLRAAAGAGRARHRHQNRLRARHGAQIRSAPPRHQAGQHLVQRRPRAEAGGLRPRAQGRRGTGESRT